MNTPALGQASAPFRERAAWCCFDFANSSFTTIMVTVIYPTIFVAMANDPHRGDVAWAWALASSAVIALALSPVVGAMADQHAKKKVALCVTWLVCIAGCAALSFIPRSGIWLAWFFFVCANLGFALGENLIAAFLPELAPKEKMGRLSGAGWAVGYLGGLLSLAAALHFVAKEWTAFVPLLVAVFFFLAGLPTFLVLRERARPQPATRAPIRSALTQIRRTLARRADYPDLFRLLVVLFLEQAGVMIVISFSALYAQAALGMSTSDVIVLFIALQIAAAAGALVFGSVQDAVGGKRALIGTLVVWIVAVAATLSMRSEAMFYVGSALAGIAIGSSQASGRAMVALFTPAERQGEWFGLWGIATKAATVLGVVAYGIARQAASIRVAMASTVVFFVLSLVVLLTVDEARGRRAAGSA